MIKFLKQHLLEKWYAHLIREDQMIVLYRDKEFKVKEGDDYSSIREYGLAHGVIDDQLPGQGLFDQAREEGL